MELWESTEDVRIRILQEQPDVQPPKLFQLAGGPRTFIVYKVCVLLMCELHTCIVARSACRVIYSHRLGVDDI